MERSNPKELLGQSTLFFPIFLTSYSIKFQFHQEFLFLKNEKRFPYHKVSKYYQNILQSKLCRIVLSTLISLINVEPTLTDFEKFHLPQNKNPPSTFIDFLNFSALRSSFIRVMYILVFSKKSYPLRLFQPPRLVVWQFLLVISLIEGEQK